MQTFKTQSYANHRRTVFGYHILLGGLAAADFIYEIIQLLKGYSTPGLFRVVAAMALLLAAWYIRQFPRVVQDRLIRLEETLRMQRVLPPNMQGRIREITPSQFVGLRFATDEELPGLVQKVLDEKITNRGEIKKLITTWRPDLLRI